MSNNQPIVRQAVEHFRSGRYEQAKTCYQEAAARYGPHLFAKNVLLCELRMGGSVPRQALGSNGGAQVAVGDLSTAHQLDETQKLLEHYYTRCQELEHQLLDR